MNKTIACPECNGHGFITECGENWIGSRGCKNCNGSGTVEVSMTNADHVRAMSDEELAEGRVYSHTHGNMEVWCGDFYGWEYTKEAAIERELEWLQQPYKEDA